MARQYTSAACDCLLEKFPGQGDFWRVKNRGAQQANVNIAFKQSKLKKPQKNTEFSIDTKI